MGLNDKRTEEGIDELNKERADRHLDTMQTWKGMATTGSNAAKAFA